MRVNKKRSLVEGVKYGQKEENWVTNNLDDFRLGIEIELRVLAKDIKDIDVSNYSDSGMTIQEVANMNDSNIIDFATQISQYVAKKYQETTQYSDNPLIVGVDEFIREVISGQYTEQFKEYMSTNDKAVLSFIPDENLSEIIEHTINCFDELPIMDEVLEHYSVFLDELLEVNVAYLNDDEELYNKVNDLLDSLRELDTDKFMGSVSENLTSGIESISFGYMVKLRKSLTFLSLWEMLFPDQLITEALSDMNMSSEILTYITTINSSELMQNHLPYIKKISKDIKKRYKTKYRIVDEHDEQIEIITRGKIIGEDIITAYEESFDMIEYITKNYPFETSSKSGLHLSISKIDATNKKPNVTKFIILSNILNLIPTKSRYVRHLVDDINNIMYDTFPALLEMLKLPIIDGSYSKLFTDIVESWVDVSLTQDKLQSVNFRDVNVSKGRIEMRFFGGEGYESDKELAWNQTLRSMYSLMLAYDDDLMRKEYLQTLSRFVENIFKKKLGTTFYEYARNTHRLHKALRISTEQDNMVLPIDRKITRFHGLIDLSADMAGFDEETTNALKNDLVPLKNGMVMVPNEKTLKLLSRTRSNIVNETRMFLKENNMRLKDIAEIKVDFPDADFYITRRGSIDEVGNVSKEYDKYKFGVKVTSDQVLPDYLYYVLKLYHDNGVWRRVATGSLRLVNLRKSDIENLKLDS